MAPEEPGEPTKPPGDGMHQMNRDNSAIPIGDGSGNYGGPGQTGDESSVVSDFVAGLQEGGDDLRTGLISTANDLIDGDPEAWGDLLSDPLGLEQPNDAAGPSLSSSPEEVGYDVMMSAPLLLGKGKGKSPIKGYTKHGLNQAISRNGGKGVSVGAINDAVRNPQKVTTQSGGRIKYKGNDATVITNDQGKVITTYGKPRNK